MSFASTAGLIGAVIALIEIIKLLIQKFAPNKLEKDVNDIKHHIYEVKATTARTLEMHEKYDADGTPLWYVPRSLGDNQTKVLECVQEISHTMERVVSVLDRMDRRYNGD